MKYLVFTFLCLATVAYGQRRRYAPYGLKCQKSAHSAKVTIDRLQAILEEKGFKIMARVDHASNAAGVGKTLRPTKLLIFGNPAIGTQLMESQQSVGIDLPMKALAWENEKGEVWMSYNKPSYLSHRHSIFDRDPVIAKMTKAIGGFISKAIAAE